MKPSKISPELVKVAGVDVYFIGAGDLSQSMGYPGQQTHPEVQALVEKGVQQIAASGIIAGCSCPDNLVPHYLELGVRYFHNTVGRLLQIRQRRLPQNHASGCRRPGLVHPDTASQPTRPREAKHGMTSPVDPNQICLTGENSFIRLSASAGGPNTTRSSHWRVLWSPAGAGHVLFLKSEDFNQNPDRVYSDNIALTRYLQQEIETLLFPEFADVGLPVIAAGFSKSGDPANFWTETVAAADETVVLSCMTS